MRKLNILIIQLFVGATAFSQNCDFSKNSVEADHLCNQTATQLQTGNATIIARDAVILKPGFEITTANLNGNRFNATTNHSIVAEPTSYATTGSGGVVTLPEYTGFIPATLGGVVDVSPTGAATYQIPIQVSPGSNGMQPNLSIVYSSQSGNGLLGMGWNLSGLSAISRENKNQYYDNTVGPITLGVNDALSLDGTRLIYNSTLGGYSPVNNPYVKVVFSNNEFTVTTQDGSVSQYGVTSNSKFKTTNPSVTHTWALNRTTDPNGNYIDYIYSENSSTGEHLISEIKYTGNVSGKEPYNSVKFYYDLRNDPSSFYIAGNKSRQTALLTGIKVFCEGALSKQYEFDYSYSLYSKLNRVTLTADGVKYAPTVINWGTPDYTAYSDGPFDTAPTLFADFNGDGISESVYVSNGKINFYSPASYCSIELPSYEPEIPHHTWTVRWANLYGVDVVDFNGDGIDELMVHISYTENYIEDFGDAKTRKYTFDVRDSIFSYRINDYTLNRSFIKEHIICENLVNPIYTPESNYKYYYADLNNDGRTDNLLINNSVIESFNGNSIATVPTLTDDIHDVGFIDFDGDGGLEVLFLNISGRGSIWKYSGSALHKLYSSESFFESHPDITQIPFFPGDFNGDGKTDYLTRYDYIDSNYLEASDWLINYSTGTSYIPGTLPDNLLTYLDSIITPGLDLDYDPNSCDSYTYLLNKAHANLVSTADVNNDGKSDITFATQNNKIMVYLSIGESFTGLDPVDTWFSLSNLRVKDIDNDGNVDILCGEQLTIFPNLNGSNFVNSISDGLGNLSQFTYSIYNDNTETTNLVYPLSLVRGPLKVVSNLAVTTEANIVSNITYTYSEGLRHLQGLGFLGFGKVKSENSVNNLSSETTFAFKIDDDNYRPWVSSVTTKKGGVTVSTQSNTMTIVGDDTTNKLFLHVPWETTTTDIVRGVTTNTVNTFDSSLGRITKQEVTTGEWGSTTDYVYEQVDGITSRLQSLTTVRNNADDNFTSTQVFGYDSPSSYRVNRVTAQGKTTNFTSFDPYGNVTGTRFIDRQTSCTFDSKGRFMESLTNVQGLTSTFTYRYSDGMKLSETNANGLTVTHSAVPAAGVLTVNTTSPDGNIATNTLGWSSSVGKYFKSSSVTNGNTVTTYHNSAGQTVRKTSLGFEGAQHYTDYSYNSKGQLSTEQSSGIATPTAYTYDNLDRIASISGHNDLSVSYAYGTNTVTTTSSVTGAETKTFDALGNVTSLVAPTGTIDYTYFASGKIKQLNAEGAVTQMVYDNFGNQLSLTEPNSGETSYIYNDYNELVTQTNAMGTTHMTYDKGLIKTITGSDYSKVYAYYEDPGKLGLLKSISRDNVIETYNYDNLGRLTSTTVTDGTNTFTTTQQFNSKGQVEQTAYPTGLTAGYTYDVVGNLKSITDVNNSNKALWTGVAKNERDDWTSIALGNGLSTTYEYNTSTYMLKGIKTGAGKAPQYILNWGFTFNTKGQLEQRTEGTLIENFSYDDMNRLTREKVTNGYEHSTAYKSNGNIETATAAGVFTYLSSKPHAVATVTGEATKLPNLQITTSSQFTSDGRISLIENKAYKNTFTYGPSGMRFKVDHYEGATKVGSKIYVGNSEFLLNPSGTIDTARTMVYAPTGICAVYEKVGTNPSKMFYIHTDYLGSWLAITNESGKVENRYSYDAWGRPRNPYTWKQLTQYPVTVETLNAMQPRFDRGYTGHEHMASFGLINMNGRVYDPYLQRFVSPDPHVTDPSNPQNYNRYSYCLNNPLMYTDPTGYDIANYDDWRNRDEARREITTTELMNLGTFDTWCASLDNWHFLDPDSQWGYNGRGNPLIDWERFNRRMEAAFADWNSRPGAGENGNGANGSYWDWRTGTYRSTSTWGAVSWEHVLATAVLPFAVEISISGFSALNSRNATMGEYINFATQLASNGGGGYGGGYDGQLVAKFTLGLTKQYLRGSYGVYDDVRPVVMSPTKGKTHYDCSGWLAYVLNNTYPSLLKAMAPGGMGPTSMIENYAKLNGGIGIVPHVGDIAIWGGHVEIVVSVDGTVFQTNGSSGKGGSLIPTTKTFNGTDDTSLGWYGNGTFLGFWTPVLP